MHWRAVTDSIMATSRSAMGEPVLLNSGGSQYPLTAIFEVSTNFDETTGFADMENFDAVVDFRKKDLAAAPKKNDLVTIPRLSRSFLIIDVDDDDWGRYRCRLRDE